jgi:hypothetical protein
MTIHELKSKVDATGSFFFTHNTMKFWGDTMRNFACSAAPTEIVDNLGAKRQVYVVWRKKTNNKTAGLGSYCFDANTFARAYPGKD